MIICLALFCLSLTVPAAAQKGKDKKVKMELKDERLPQALKRLERTSGYKILFSYDDLNQFTVSKGRLNAPDIRSALDILLAGRPVTYSIDGQYVNINIKEAAIRTAKNQGNATVTYRGRVVDSSGQPLPGATVMVQGTNRGFATSDDGAFSVTADKGRSTTLRFSFVGMKPTARTYNGHQDVSGIEVKMEDDNKIEEVVVTGIFERKKEGFTGSANHMSGDDIRKLTSGNVLNAIQMLDPGFRMGDNMMSGSNPNSVPDFNMRGQSSMGDYSTDETVIMRGDIDTRPNQPLFVLDGIIDVGVTKIMDLDPAQIESITLLKDAAAMAIYGSQASNGVVVVETKAPAAGKLRVTYNGNYKLEWPDLSDYNLLNAAEKLELERRAGYYDPIGNTENQVNRYNAYRWKLLEVQRGVDSYWLSQPVQTVFNHRHGINLEGGNESLRYKLYAGINQAPGIMKGTGLYGRSASLDIRYRYKGLLISNITYVDYTKSDRTSPYGTFDEYTLLNPYYRIYDTDGQIKQYLEQSTISSDHINSAGMTVGNPMYNTLYNTLDRNIAFEIRDAFRAEYSPLPNLRLAMDFTISRSVSDLDVFKSGNHTDFITVSDLKLKGSYEWSNSTDTSYDLAFTASYNKVWQNKHVLSAYARYSVSEQKYHSAGVYSTGFPNDNMDEVYLGASVQSTSGSESTSRSLGG